MLKQMKYILLCLGVGLSLVAVQVSAQTVTLTIPTANAIGVDESGFIQVAFDKNVDPASVTSATFKVIGSVKGEYAGTIMPAGSSIYFLSAAEYAFGEKVSVILTDDIQFLDATTLTNGYTFSFTVNSCAGELFPEPGQLYPTADIVYRIIDADLNGDDKLDLIATEGSDFFSILLNDGNGDFPVHSRQYFNGYYFVNTQAADFNGDGKIDLVARNSSNNVAVLVSDASINFSILAESGPYCLVCNIYEPGACPADMDGDGDVDLLVTMKLSCDPDDEEGNNTHCLAVLYNDGGGSFGAFAIIDSYEPYFEEASNPRVADFNNDGLLDASVLIAASGETTVMTYINDGAGGYAESYSYLTQRMQKLISEDFDGDGYLDLAAFGIGPYASYVLVLNNNGAGSFVPQPLMSLNNDAYSFTSGDFDGDGDMDLATADAYSNNTGGLDLLINAGDGTFSTGPHFGEYWLDGWQLFAADVDGDMSLDLITTMESQYHPTIVAVRKNHGAADAPILRSPVNGKELSPPATPHLDCYDVADATIYLFELDDDADFSSMIAHGFSGISEWDVPVELGIGTYYWRVKATNGCGQSGWSETWSIVVRDEIIDPPPPDIEVDNFPNPFNPATTITYTLPSSAHVTLDIFNMTGQIVTTLVDQSQEAGEHSVRWDGKNRQGVSVSSGIYFYRIRSDHGIITKKMMLIK